MSATSRSEVRWQEVRVRSAACRSERPGTLRAYVWPLPNASRSACNPQRESKEKLNTEKTGTDDMPGGRGGVRRKRDGEEGNRRKSRREGLDPEAGRVRLQQV